MNCHFLHPKVSLHALSAPFSVFRTGATSGREHGIHLSRWLLSSPQPDTSHSCRMTSEPSSCLAQAPMKAVPESRTWGQVIFFGGGRPRKECRGSRESVREGEKAGKGGHIGEYRVPAAPSCWRLCEEPHNTCLRLGHTHDPHSLLLACLGSGEGLAS